MKVEIDNYTIIIKPLLIYADKLDRVCIENILKNIRTKYTHIFINPHRVLDHRQVIYSIVQSIKNRSIGIEIARKIELDILGYICCTDQIKNIVEKCIEDYNGKLLLISYCMNCNEEDLLREQYNILDNISKLCDTSIVDLAICFSCYKIVKLSEYCNDVSDVMDFMEKIVEMLLRRVE